MKTSDDTDALPVWDANALARRMGNRPTVRRRLLETFLSEAQKQIATLLQAISEEDLETAHTVAHALKSSSRTIGAMQFGELCFALELAGKAGDGPTSKALAERLNQTFAAAADKIKQG